VDSTGGAVSSAGAVASASASLKNRSRCSLPRASLLATNSRRMNPLSRSRSTVASARA
jgi:hypothetical protein